MKIKEEHFYFTSNDHKLFGILYRPQTINQFSENYLVLHPFAEEKKSSQRVLVELARKLCEDGNCILLFDFFGCGDSEGDLSASSYSIWLQDIRQASILLTKMTNLRKLNIIGLRLGAYLGSIFANESEINKMILIEPVLNPMKDLTILLRGKLIKELCTDGEITSKRKDLLQNLNDNIPIDFSGHEISTSFYKNLLEFNAIDPYKKIEKQGNDILLINISQTGRTTRKFQKLLSEIGDSIHYKIVKLEPFWGQIDTPDCSELIEGILEWSKKQNVENFVTSQDQKMSNYKDNKVNLPSHSPSDIRNKSNSFCSLPSNHKDSIRESLLTINNGKNKILGILSQSEIRNKKKATIVFLHGWAGYRIGPHRMIVDYARKFSERGFHCVRFDFRGKGFSELNEEPDYNTQLSDLECVLDSLKKLELPEKIILAGICSGAKIAIHYAMKGKIPIDGVIELSTALLRPENQFQVELSRTKSLFYQYCNKIFKRETWHKLINGELKSRLILKILISSAMLTVQFLFGKGNSLKKRNYTKSNASYSTFRGDIIAIHGEKDPETIMALQQVAALTSKYSIPLKSYIIKGANHSFYSIDWKNEIFEIIEQWLEEKVSCNDS